MGESQVGEGLEGRLDVGMTLHVAGPENPSWTSLHRGVICLDSRSPRAGIEACWLQKFKPPSQPFTSFCSMSSFPEFIPWEGSKASKGSRHHSAPPRAGPKGRTAPSLSPLHPHPSAQQRLPKSLSVLLLGLVPVWTVRLGEERVTCPSLDPGDWVQPHLDHTKWCCCPQSGCGSGRNLWISLAAGGRGAGLDGVCGPVLGTWRQEAQGEVQLGSPLLRPPRTPFCEWHQSTSLGRRGTRVQPRGRGRGALKSPEECPPLCSQ